MVTQENPSALPSALESIKEADLIVLGPGSLYTSLLPNLLVPEIVDALLQSNAPKIYISNLMTQPGETDGLDVYQHIKSIEKQLSNFGVNTRIFNAILSEIQFEKSPLIDYYESRGAEPLNVIKNNYYPRVVMFCRHHFTQKRITPTLRHDQEG